MHDIEKFLEEVDWSAVSHAYGNATDTPELLKDLMSVSRSQKALEHLFASINHQGDQSMAGLCGCPYLVELIKNPEIPNLDAVLDLILGIAVGRPDDHLLMGEKIQESLCKSKTQAQTNPHWNLPIDCHDAVQHGVNQFLGLLEHPLREVSWQAAYNLAWFPDQSARTLSALRNKLSASQDPPIEFVNYLLPTGLLEWHSNRKCENYKQITELLVHPDKLLRYSAAVYCSWFDINERVVDVLVKLAEDDQFDGSRDSPHRIVFCSGNLRQFAEETLGRHRLPEN